ncbi:fatty acyl-AMP ligase [Streptomyces caniscabiei]|uniref:fatty acyl-AMP ligase n=1 Tax=Streptomyces caniscabiei TaxID=2746961 RepID=UPI0029A731B1|nr:fatty acyl-AMP ligase [Streptomyces caniscabiei]MDX2599668.1 fatty acyl-AMP ligase [Streptomyces caniscabiei]MDX2735037.1 fatty acyl-AMP ligase [Streptomyces caniscabiei]MDX2776733.1 fatty acyl-AMP ligase [Streptomyces caniscabiei]
MVDLLGARSVSEIFALHAHEQGDRPAVAIVSDPSDPDSAQWLNYGQLDQAARVFAQELLQVCPIGSRVLLLQPTSAEFVASVLGCIYAGMIAVPSSMPGRYQQDQRRVLGIAHDAAVGCVLTTPADREEVIDWAEQQGFTMPVLSLRIDPERRADDVRVHEADQETVAVLQYTSGSTTDPKGSVVTHGNLLANAATTAAAFPMEDGQRFGGWLPNYHDMGLIGLILSPLLSGRGTALMSPAAFLRRPRAWLQLIENFNIALTAAPNFAYDLCLSKVSDADTRELDLSGWKYAVSGSEPVSARVLDDFTARFASAGFKSETFVPSFGMAEATLLVTATPGRSPVVLHCDPGALERDRVEPASDGSGRAMVSCGEPLDLEVRIVDPQTHEELPPGRVGEIWLRGQSVVHGYWRNDQATRATFGQRLDGEDGFLRTGDLGVLIGGELYVTGRIKEMMIIRGRNIYPHDVEDELRRHHQPLRDVVGSVVSVPTDQGDDGRLVVIHEVRRQAPEQELSRLAAQMRTTVAREFGLHADAVLILRRGGVRRTTSGKVQRSVMRALYLRGELQPLWADGYVPSAELATSGTGEPS